MSLEKSNLFSWPSEVVETLPPVEPPDCVPCNDTGYEMIYESRCFCSKCGGTYAGQPVDFRHRRSPWYKEDYQLRKYMLNTMDLIKGP